MYKTSMRAAFEVALSNAPHGKVQQFVRRAVARRAGTRPPRVIRKVRVQQVWSSSRAAAEFMS